jgi:hypothetical protein
VDDVVEVVRRGASVARTPAGGAVTAGAAVVLGADVGGAAVVVDVGRDVVVDGSAVVGGRDT